MNKDMNKSLAAQCATAVSLFRGLYGRVARGLGVDVSYISRIARGQRKSKAAEKALAKEFNQALRTIGHAASVRFGNNPSRASTR